MSVDRNRQLKALDIGNSFTSAGKLAEDKDISVAFLIESALEAHIIVAVFISLDVEITGSLVPLDPDAALILGCL